MVLPNCPRARWRFRRDLYPALRTTLERDREKSAADAISSMPAQKLAPPHHPVDRLLPLSSLQCMKRLLERKSDAEAKSARAGA